LLVASLGQSSVFTRPGERQLWVLGEDEAPLWDLHSLALNATDTETLLAERFGLGSCAKLLWKPDFKWLKNLMAMALGERGNDERQRI
jgi:hypothetical protein